MTILTTACHIGPHPAAVAYTPGAVNGPAVGRVVRVTGVQDVGAKLEGLLVWHSVARVLNSGRGCTWKLPLFCWKSGKRLLIDSIFNMFS